MKLPVELSSKKYPSFNCKGFTSIGLYYSERALHTRILVPQPGDRNAERKTNVSRVLLNEPWDLRAVNVQVVGEARKMRRHCSLLGVQEDKIGGGPGILGIGGNEEASNS